MLEHALGWLVYGASVQAIRRRDFDDRTRAYRVAIRVGSGHGQVPHAAVFRAQFVNFYQQLGFYLECCL